MLSISIFCIFQLINQIEMGNEQSKKVGRANKNQIQMACLKAKIHLQLMRDRKSQQIIKGEKELVTKLNAKSRNRTEQALIMERVVNGLKYSQAVNQLISYAVSLKSQAGFLADNIGNQQKLQPWLTSVHSLLYAADQLGLSSLTEFKTVMKALNDPMQAEKFINPEIKQMLTPTPTPYQVNIYVLEMCERNNIQIQEINAAGHKFSKQPMAPSSEGDKSFADIEKQLASQMHKQFTNPNGGFSGGNNNGNGNGNGNFGGMGGNMGGQGFNNYPPGPPGYYGPPPPGHNQKNQSNPYQGASTINHGPNYFVPSQIQPQNKSKIIPKQFSSYDNINIDQSNRKTIEPIYPSVNPHAYVNNPYNPQSVPSNGQNGGDAPNGNPVDNKKSPTISQIMRQFDIK